MALGNAFRRAIWLNKKDEKILEEHISRLVDSTERRISQITDRERDLISRERMLHRQKLTTTIQSKSIAIDCERSGCESILSRSLPTSLSSIKCFSALRQPGSRSTSGSLPDIPSSVLSERCRKGNPCCVRRGSLLSSKDSIERPDQTTVTTTHIRSKSAAEGFNRKLITRPNNQESLTPLLGRKTYVKSRFSNSRISVDNTIANHQSVYHSQTLNSVRHRKSVPVIGPSLNGRRGRLRSTSLPDLTIMDDLKNCRYLRVCTADGNENAES